MNITTYLNRINYAGSLTLTAQTLRDLQMAHLLSVPFENLSIHANEPIVLTEDALFDKIVTRRRGGFCYEMNGLFAALLRGLGFEVAMLSAGVATEDGRFTPPFDHMALMVTLEQRWLLDVGFGDTFRQPLLLGDEEVVADNSLPSRRSGGRFYQILSDDTHLTLMEQKGDNPWRPQYRFTLQGYNFPDYAHMCHHNQTSPDSHFTQGRVCTIATQEGRITLAGGTTTLDKMQLITTTLKGERQERRVTTEAEYAELLLQHFDIIM